MGANHDARSVAKVGIILALFSFFSQWTHGGLSPTQATVMVWSTIAESPAEIRLRWAGDPAARAYEISRKRLTDEAWTRIGSTTGTVNEFVDRNVVVGIPYEYMVVKDTGIPQLGYGYLCAGIRVPATDSRGRMILLVEKSLAAPLNFSLARLEQDLIGDGWTVIRHDVGATDAVTSVKALVRADYLADPVNTKGLLLFGNLPVPYSGNIAVDGHEDHRGAWPADVYYGEFDGAWTDSSVTATNVAHFKNRNVPGDGKFDQSVPPGKVRLQVGRVDLSNLTCFINQPQPRTELDLARQYLRKDHAFRHGELNVARRGLLFNHWGGAEDEPLGSTSWRTFAGFFGTNNLVTIADDEFASATSANSYLWAFHSWWGDTTFAAGVGTSGDFAVIDPKIVFTAFGGSYFGDWDRESNFLRAALGAPSHLLTTFYGGQPQWVLHRMSLGETIGEAALLTQNNGTNGIYLPHRNYGVGEVHIALLGDPSLRMHPIAPPTGLTASMTPQGMKLQWTKSTDAAVSEYSIYRGESTAGPFVKINRSGTVTGSSYVDGAGNANSMYMVRAVKLEQTPSGSYFNLSQGAFYPNPLEAFSLEAPSGVTISTVRPEGLKLSWVDRGGAAEEFRIQRRSLSSAQFATVGKAQGFESQFLDSTVTPGAYAYRVQAVGENGEVKTSEEATIHLWTPAVASSAIDKATLGNWIGKYGQDGYVIFDAGTNLPSYVNLELGANATRYIASLQSDKPEALLRPDGSEGLLAYRMGIRSLEVRLRFTDSALHRVALYDSDLPWSKAEVINPLTGAVLAATPFTNSTGHYLVFDVRNTVDIRLSVSNDTQSASVSGVFFSPALLEAPVISPGSGSFPGRTTVTMQALVGTIRYTTDGSDPTESSAVYTGPISVRNNTTFKARTFKTGYEPSVVTTVSLVNSLVTAASFVKEDVTTQGEWPAAYGQDGFLYGTRSQVPGYWDLNLNGAQYFSWSETTTEARALSKNGAGTGGVASCWYNPTELLIDTTAYSEGFRILALYFVDWDRQGRVEEITLTGPAGEVLDRRRVENFGNGKYLVWNVKGSVRISIKKIAGNNAIVNGFFFGTPIVSSAPAELSTLLSAGSQKLRVTGQPGQTFDVQYSGDLRAWISMGQETLSSNVAELTLPVPNGPGCRFYRAVLVQ